MCKKHRFIIHYEQEACCCSILILSRKFNMNLTKPPQGREKEDPKRDRLLKQRRRKGGILFPP
jgi:hypothetical protein